MEHLALEGLHARQFARLRNGKRAHTGNQDLRSSCYALFGLQVEDVNFPYFIYVIPFCFLHDRVEANVINNTVLLSNTTEVGLDLRSHGILAAPVWIQGKAVRIEV